jgi:L-aminopeptidase/D-esterase-like protein
MKIGRTRFDTRRGTGTVVLVGAVVLSAGLVAAGPVSATPTVPATQGHSGASAAGVPFAPVAGQPGENNAVTDVPGVQIGQVQATTAPYLTGTTVVYFPTMSVAGVDQEGGAPATKETDLLSPLNSNPGVNAIQLGGSSMYGLDATSGIIRWLEDRGEGVGLGSTGVAPIVPAADIYDLGRGGDIKARTTAEWGYLAADAATAGPVRQGTVGGGTGARSGGMKGGVGTASVYLGDGIYVGAIVVVNSAGSPMNASNCTLWGAQFGVGDEFDGLTAPLSGECHPNGTAAASADAQTSEDLNTTIAVVVTNLPLEKAAAERLASNAHDGMARAINPIHTLGDGDTVFGVSTGSGAPLRINDPTAGGKLNQVFNAGATALSRAITKAILSATTVGTARSYCDRYPSACRDMPQLASWRTAGDAPVVTPKTFKEATKKLQIIPVPKPAK